MTTITLKQKYVDVFQGFGTLEDIVEEALNHYAVDKIRERLEQYQQKVQPFEEKYGLTYQHFMDRVMTDEAFEEHLWQTDPTWKTELGVWEYYAEGLAEWHGRLQNILNG